VRPRAGAASAFSVRGHELLGWLALATAVLHVGLLLGVDNRVAEHVKLTAPRYEYAGILALFTLLFLTVPGGAATRSWLWQRHRNFQAAHVGAACLLVVTLAVHVLTTGSLRPWPRACGRVHSAIGHRAARTAACARPETAGSAAVTLPRQTRVRSTFAAPLGNRPRIARRAACADAQWRGSGSA